MKALHTTDPTAFLNKVQPALEQDEAANQPMLALCSRLIDRADLVEQSVMVWTEDTQGLTAAALLVPPGPLYLFSEPLLKIPSLRLLINMLRDVQYNSVRGKSHAVETYCELWCGFFSGSSKPIRQVKVYKISAAGHSPLSTGTMRPAAVQDAEQLIEWLDEYDKEIKPDQLPISNRAFIREETAKGNIFVWEDGLMVSMAAKRLITRHGAAIDRLFPPPVLRGRGYATMLARSLSLQLIHEGNNFCSASIDADNQPASHLLQKVGFVPVCDIEEIELKK